MVCVYYNRDADAVVTISKFKVFAKYLKRADRP